MQHDVEAGTGTRRRIMRWCVAGSLLAGSILAVAANVAYYIEHQAGRDFKPFPPPPPDFAVIEKDLFVGGLLQKPPEGTQAVLNVCDLEDPYGVEFHRWQPIPDEGPAPSLAWLQAQVEFIDENRRAGRSVYIHCAAGVNRGPTLTAAYLMWRDGLSRDQALEVVQQKRTQTNPYPVYRAFLLEWEKALREKGGKGPP